MCLKKWELVVVVAFKVDDQGDDEKLEGSQEQSF
jgi:hypothetical protein